MATTLAYCVGGSGTDDRKISIDDSVVEGLKSDLEGAALVDKVVRVVDSKGLEHWLRPTLWASWTFRPQSVPQVRTAAIY